MEINSTKLTEELKEAGIPMTGVNSSGVIFFTTEATDADKVAAQEIVKNHDPYDYIALRNGPDGYAPVADQLEMMFQDKVNGTETWLEHRKTIDNKFPRPTII